MLLSVFLPPKAKPIKTTSSRALSASLGGRLTWLWFSTVVLPVDISGCTAP